MDNVTHTASEANDDTGKARRDRLLFNISITLIAVDDERGERR